MKLTNTKPQALEPVSQTIFHGRDSGVQSFVAGVGGGAKARTAVVVSCRGAHHLNKRT